MSAEIDILKALQKAGLAAVAASILPNLPVKALMITFAIPNDQKYLEFVHIPNNRLGDFWGNEQNHRGIFRLILHWPIDHTGAYPPLEVLHSIASYFSKDTKLEAQVKIYENPQFTDIGTTGNENLYMVSLYYQSFRP